MDLHSIQNSNNYDEGFNYREKHAHRRDVIERLVQMAGTGLVSLLGLRFIFALLAANPENGFASFIYNFTAPFTTPFYNLFSYDHPSLVGASTFEGYTLVAMLVYGLATASLSRLAGLTRY